MSERPTKKVSESAINDNIYIIQPTDLNYLNTIFGGTVMAEADKIAAAVARRHSCQTCVTLSVDKFQFLSPARVGEILVFKAAVNRVWNTSMEVGVKVFAQNPQQGEYRHVVSAYFTFVPIENSRPVPAKFDLLPETEDEKRRWREADERRQRRLAERDKK